MNDYTPQILAFPGLDFITDAVGGAVGNVTGDIVNNLTGWVLSSAFSIFGFAVDLAFSNDGIIAGCNADNVEECSRTSFVTESFQRSLTVSAAIALIALLYTVMKTVITGDPGQLARKAFFDAPRIIITSVFLLQGTIIIMLVTDEIAGFLASPTLGPARNEYLESFSAQQLIDNPESIEQASFVVALLGLLLTIGSVLLWVLMMLRSVVIAILIALAPLVAALAIGGNTEGWSRLIKLLFAVITSKIVVIVVLSLGISAMVQVPFIQQGLNPDAVVTAPPIEPGVDGEIGDVEIVAANMEVAYQIATGVLLVFAATFSPILVLQLLPDSVEQFYAFNNAGGILDGAKRRGSSGAQAGGGAVQDARRNTRIRNAGQNNPNPPTPRAGTRVGR